MHDNLGFILSQQNYRNNRAPKMQRNKNGIKGRCQQKKSWKNRGITKNEYLKEWLWKKKQGRKRRWVSICKSISQSSICPVSDVGMQASLEHFPGKTWHEVGGCNVNSSRWVCTRTLWAISRHKFMPMQVFLTEKCKWSDALIPVCTSVKHGYIGKLPFAYPIMLSCETHLPSCSTVRHISHHALLWETSPIMLSCETRTHIMA